MRRVVQILRRFGETSGCQHPYMEAAISNHDQLVAARLLVQAVIRIRTATPKETGIVVETAGYGTTASCCDEIAASRPEGSAITVQQRSWRLGPNAPSRS